MSLREGRIISSSNNILIMELSSKNNKIIENKTDRIGPKLPGGQSYNGPVNMKETTIQIRISQDKKNNWLDEAEKFDKTLTRFIIDTIDGVIDQTITTDPIELKKVIAEIFNLKFKELKLD